MAKWYAVQKDRTDAWDNGSHDYNTAVEMLKEQGCGLIAVINEDTGVCEEEIEYDDIFEAREGNMPSRFWEGEPAEGDDYPVAHENIYGDEPLPFE